MEALQRQARALGDPTRYGIFRYVVGAPGPVGVAELTARFEVNHNAVRQHLAKLVEAELLTESRRSPTGPGRPRLQYTPHPTADSRWGAVGPYERLSWLLSEIVRTGDTPADVGRRWAAGAVGAESGAADATTAMADEMARHGFRPTVDRRGDTTVITLHNCPFASTALSDPDTVCSLHLGMARGFADAIGGIVVDDLAPTDPRRARCRLRCHLQRDAPAGTTA